MNDPLASFPSAPLSLISTKQVPNVFPTSSADYRLAVVGEAPGEREEAFGQPFIGPSGDLLSSLLASCGITRSACFIGNVCKYRPPGNDITEFGYAHPKVQEGWLELQDELKTYAPHAILALGDTPLHFLTGRMGITSWRGSILTSPYGKVIPSIHPAAVLREYKQWPLLRFDIQRAREEANSPNLHLPQRTLELDLTANEICHRLDNWPAGKLLSFDIEGGLGAFPCCSVADLSSRGFIIAWGRHSENEQGRIAVSLSLALYSQAIPKVLQNSLYDRFVLAYAYRMLIRNVVEDTMVKHWEIYPEASGKQEDETGKAKKGMGKNLGVICSIWTREPYYKFERKTDDPNKFYEYCIKDSCVTLEACLAMDNALSPHALRHYRFNMDLLSPLLYMELRGIRYDATTAASELAKVRVALAECSQRLSLRAGYSLTGAKGSVSATKLKKCLYAEKGYPEQKKGRGADAKTSTDVNSILNLQKKLPDDPFLADILLHRKLESLVETLEVRTDPDGRVRCGYNLVGTETGRLTCYTSPTGSGANLQTITKKLRRLYVADDGHWMFQCDLSGADGWTVAARCLQHGDATMWDDYSYGLKPALIIVLMYLGKITNSTSRDEIKALSNQYKQWEADHESESWLYFACKRIQHASNYGVQWKTGCAQIMQDSYRLTGKPVYLEKGMFESLQRLYFVRYPGIFQWHNWARKEVESGRNLISASGHERKFFGRRKSYDAKRRCYEADHETWKEFLADEPQENTTYATNLALHKLWHDPTNRIPELDNNALLPHATENNETIRQQTTTMVDESEERQIRTSSGSSRRRTGSLIIEPLHQVHDALIGQFPRDRTEWAVSKIRSYFHNPLHIAGTELVIPFEGSYGPSWGELGSKYGGGEI